MVMSDAQGTSRWCTKFCCDTEISYS